MSAVAPLVRIRDLAYSYPGGPEILRIPALDVSGRGLIAITGPSGAGKSTFVELLAGTSSPDTKDRSRSSVRSGAIFGEMPIASVTSGVSGSFHRTSVSFRTAHLARCSSRT